MFAEHLRFRVEPGRATDFQAHNHRWSAALARQDGWLGQEVLRHADKAETWLVVVRWRDRAAMLAFPDEVQRALDDAGATCGTLVQADHFEEVGA